MTTDLTFDATDDSDIDNMDDVVFMDAENKDEMLGRFQKPYLFDSESGRPREGFFVRMATLSVMKKFERLTGVKNTNSQQQFQALCELIADGVVDKAGEPIWSDDQVKSMGSTNVPRFMCLQRAVLDRNGMRKLDELVEDAAKN